MPHESIRIARRLAVSATVVVASHVTLAQAAPARLDIPTDKAHVVHVGAPLRATPDLAAAPVARLRAHETLTILDRGRAPDGWLQVRQGLGDRASNVGWVRVDDVASGLEQSQAPTR